MYRLALLLLLPVLLLAGSGAHALDLDRIHAERILNHGEASGYCDASGLLTAADLQSHPERFQAMPGSMGKGFTRAACWLRLPLHRQQGPTVWWFALPTPYLDDVQLYLFAADGSVQVRHTGDRQPFASRDARFGSFYFHFQVPQGDSTLLVRVKTSSSMMVMLKLQPGDQFPTSPATIWLISGIYLGIIFTALLLSLVHVLLSRERIYLLYMLYLVVQFMVGAAVTGMLAEFVLPDRPLLADRLVGFCAGMLVLLSMTFFWRLLRLGDGYRWLLGFFGLTATAGLLAALAALEGDWYGRVAPVMYACLLVTTTLAILPMVRRLRHGQGEDRMFALSFAAYVLFVWTTVPSLSGMALAGEAGLYLAQVANMVHLAALQVSMVMHVRRLEQDAVIARQQADQQQRLAEDQEQFLTMITQELRTPLSIIDAASRSLRLHDEGAARVREQRYSRIADAVHRMDLLVRLTLSRARLGEESGDALELVDLAALTRQIIGQMPGELQSRIVFDGGSTPALVRAQPALLQFALINLLDNACKYSPAGTPVNVVIALWPAQGQVSWSISDQGPGVPPEDRQRIFEKYYRAGDRTGKPGLGLGLFIARSLIERYRGQLQYREQPGGACFELRLPLSGEKPGRGDF